MDKIKKFIMPVMILLAVGIIYTVYFAPGGELGDFTAFDTNNNANKEIRVKVIKEKGIEKDMANGVSMFFAVDKNGMEVLVHAPLELPPTFEMHDVFTIKGHLHKEYFHATEILAK